MTKFEEINDILTGENKEITIEDERQLSDGIYNIENIEFIEINTEGKNDNKAQKFIKKYPKYIIGSAYETDTMFLLSKIPPEIKNQDIGSGFNYGSCNIIQNCPTSILILAQND